MSHKEAIHAVASVLGRRSQPRTIAVALSGGVDSMCLAYILGQYKRQHQPDLDVLAITIDHQYRADSSEEALAVRKLVQRWGIRHTVEKLTYEKSIANITNFEEVARIKRYQAFERVCEFQGITSLFVGHNLDDQLETFIHRLKMSSSLFGLAGLKELSPMPVPSQGPHSPGIWVCRPLLQFSKSQLIDICTQNHVEWFEDATNQDIHLTPRNLHRFLLNEVIPLQKYGDLQKADLNASLAEVKQLTSTIRKKARILQEVLAETGELHLDKRNGSLQVSLPKDLFQDSALVVSQLLSSILRPVSSVKHFHWSYAKIERRLVPNIVAYVRSASQVPLKLTYLNLSFEIHSTVTKIFMRIRRQPAIRESLPTLAIEATTDWSEWYLFDNRFWIRSKGGPLQVTCYEHRQHKKSLAAITSSMLSREMDGAPLVIQKGIPVGLPSYGIMGSGAQVECLLKE